MNELLITVLVTFFPGVIATVVFNHLTVQKQKDKFIFFGEIFIFGIISHLIYASIYAISANFFTCCTGKIFFFDIINRSDYVINLQQLGYVTLIAFVLGIIITYLFNYKVAFRIAHKFKMTKRFGDIDVWAYTMNSNEIDWVTVRDKEHDLMYTGWINAFSDSYDSGELLLKDVTVYKSSTGEEMYKVGAKYLSFEKSNIDLEFFNVPLSNIEPTKLNGE